MAVPARAGENVPGAGGSGRVSMATEGYFLRLDWICLVEREVLACMRLEGDSGYSRRATFWLSSI